MSLLGVIVDNFGQTIELTVVDIDTEAAVDISTYTTKQIQFKDPGGTVTTKTAAFVTDGTDGKIDYDLEDELIDTDGTWKVRAKLSAVAGVLHSKWIEMPVEA
jgi:hypothetical protein